MGLYRRYGPLLNVEYQAFYTGAILLPLMIVANGFSEGFGFFALSGLCNWGYVVTNFSRPLVKAMTMKRKCFMRRQVSSENSRDP